MLSAVPSALRASGSPGRCEAAEPVVFGHAEVTTAPVGDIQQVAGIGPPDGHPFRMEFDLGRLSWKVANQEVFLGPRSDDRSDISESISKADFDEQIQADCRQLLTATPSSWWKATALHGSPSRTVCEKGNTRLGMTAQHMLCRIHRDSEKERFSPLLQAS